MLLHVSLGSRRSLLCWIGYGVGLLACGIHLAEIFGTEVASHQFGLRLIKFGFGALAVLAALALWKDQQQRKGAGMRMLGAMALFLFAVSFVHFGEAHGTDAWAHELLLHHAGIPLALVVLLQDYRFLLLDVFIRFLGNRQHVPLEEELRTVQVYLEVERLRLGSRLATQIDVSQPARRVEIPALSIQPLVENAVKPGISRKAEGGSIRLEAAVEDGALEVTVSDDGPGFPSSGPRENGQGLENVRRGCASVTGNRAGSRCNPPPGAPGSAFACR